MKTKQIPVFGQQNLSGRVYGRLPWLLKLVRQSYNLHLWLCRMYERVRNFSQWEELQNATDHTAVFLLIDCTDSGIVKPNNCRLHTSSSFNSVCILDSYHAEYEHRAKWPDRFSQCDQIVNVWRKALFFTSFAQRPVSIHTKWISRTTRGIGTCRHRMFCQLNMHAAKIVLKSILSRDLQWTKHNTMIQSNRSANCGKQERFYVSTARRKTKTFGDLWCQ